MSKIGNFVVLVVAWLILMMLAFAMGAGLGLGIRCIRFHLIPKPVQPLRMDIEIIRPPNAPAHR